MWNDFLRRLHPAAVLAGFALCLLALAARTGGYRRLQITPIELFVIGVAVIIAAIGATAQRAAWAAMREDIAQVESSPRFVRFLPVLAAQLAFATLVAVAAFWFNRDQLLGYIDGQYLLTLVSDQANFAAPSLVFSSNPLQGIGDLWYSTNTLWIPELSIARLFSDAGVQKVAVHAAAFAEIFAATSLLAFWLGYSPGKATASGWLAVLMFAPLTYPSLIYNLSPDAPNIATAITFPVLLIVLWAGVGRRALWMDAARTLAIGFLFWWHFIAVGILTTIAYPLVGIVGAVFTLALWPKRAEFWRKIGCGLVLALFVFISGLPQTLLGIIGDTAFHLFPQELPTREVRLLSDGSILLRRDQPVGVIVAALAIVGAALHTCYGSGRMRRFAGAILLTVTLLVTAAVANVFVALPGAIPIYYEFALWGVYPIFAVAVLAAPWQLASHWFSARLGPTAIPLARWQWFVLPIAGLFVLHGANFLRGIRTERPNVYPPVASALTEYLRGQVGLAPGAPFRGRVVTLTGQRLPGPATWPQMFEFDMRLIRALGNEHRSIGLWYYHIPTLMEFSQTLPPLIYQVVKRYLARQGDPQYRSLLNIRHANIHVLRLLGVRYVLTDGPPVAGTRRILEIPIPQFPESLAIDEVTDPNLGVSPVQTVRFVSGKAALEWLGETENDIGRIAITNETVTEPLMQASNIQLTVERGGIRVRASSAGRSLVVIPFQFSHCLHAIPFERGRAPPNLIRADLLLTGVIFERALDTIIRYRQTAFQRTRCRLDDLADDTALLVANDTLPR